MPDKINIVSEHEESATVAKGALLPSLPQLPDSGLVEVRLAAETIDTLARQVRNTESGDPNVSTSALTAVITVLLILVGRLLRRIKFQA